MQVKILIKRFIVINFVDYGQLMFLIFFIPDWLDGPVLPSHRYQVKTRFYPPYNNNLIPNRSARRYKNNPVKYYWLKWTETLEDISQQKNNSNL